MSVNRKRQQRIRVRDKKRHARKVAQATLLRTERILSGSVRVGFGWQAKKSSEVPYHEYTHTAVVRASGKS